MKTVLLFVGLLIGLSGCEELVTLKRDNAFDLGGTQAPDPEDLPKITVEYDWTDNNRAIHLDINISEDGLHNLVLQSDRDSILFFDKGSSILKYSNTFTLEQLPKIPFTLEVGSKVPFVDELVSKTEILIQPPEYTDKITDIELHQEFSHTQETPNYLVSSIQQESNPWSEPTYPLSVIINRSSGKPTRIASWYNNTNSLRTSYSTDWFEKGEEITCLVQFDTTHFHPIVLEQYTATVESSLDLNVFPAYDLSFPDFDGSVYVFKNNVADFLIVTTFQQKFIHGNQLTAYKSESINGPFVETDASSFPTFSQYPNIDFGLLSPRNTLGLVLIPLEESGVVYYRFKTTSETQESEFSSTVVFAIEKNPVREEWRVRIEAI